MTDSEDETKKIENILKVVRESRDLNVNETDARFLADHFGRFARDENDKKVRLVVEYCKTFVFSVKSSDTIKPKCRERLVTAICDVVVSSSETVHREVAKEGFHTDEQSDVPLDWINHWANPAFYGESDCLNSALRMFAATLRTVPADFSQRIALQSSFHSAICPSLHMDMTNKTFSTTALDLVKELFGRLDSLPKKAHFVLNVLDGLQLGDISAKENLVVYALATPLSNAIVRSTNDDDLTCVEQLFEKYHDRFPKIISWIVRDAPSLSKFRVDSPEPPPAALTPVELLTQQNFEFSNIDEYVDCCVRFYSNSTVDDFFEPETSYRSCASDLDTDVRDTDNTDDTENEICEFLHLPSTDIYGCARFLSHVLCNESLAQRLHSVRLDAVVIDSFNAATCLMVMLIRVFDHFNVESVTDWYAPPVIVRSGRTDSSWPLSCLLPPNCIVKHIHLQSISQIDEDLYDEASRLGLKSVLYPAETALSPRAKLKNDTKKIFDQRQLMPTRESLSESVVVQLVDAPEALPECLYDVPIGPRDARLRMAWDVRRLWASMETKGDGVRIGIIDTGAHVCHDLLCNRAIRFKSFIHRQHAFTDKNGHGTHCLSIMMKFAPNAEFFVACALDEDGVGSVRDLCDAFVWLRDQRCDVIAISLGTEVVDAELYRVTADILARGIVIVSAAANAGQLSMFNIAYPARFGGMICVGSHSSKGRTSHFSSAGREVDVLAPGEDIVGAFAGSASEIQKTVARFVDDANDKVDDVSPNNSAMVAKTGTSVAVPFVAGLTALLVALFKRRHIEVNTAIVRVALARLATSPGHHDSERGYGRLEPAQTLTQFGTAWLLDCVRNVYPIQTSIFDAVTDALTPQGRASRAYDVDYVVDRDTAVVNMPYNFKVRNAGDWPNSPPTNIRQLDRRLAKAIHVGCVIMAVTFTDENGETFEQQWVSTAANGNKKDIDTGTKPKDSAHTEALCLGLFFSQLQRCKSKHQWTPTSISLRFFVEARKGLCPACCKAVRLFFRQLRVAGLFDITIDNAEVARIVDDNELPADKDNIKTKELSLLSSTVTVIEK
jgi:hypothetical protein